MGDYLQRVYGEPIAGRCMSCPVDTLLDSLTFSASLVFEAICGPCIWFVKFLLFVLYVQVFRPLRWLRYLAYAGAVITGLFYLATMVALLVLCAPTEGHSQLAYWSALDSPRCLQTRSLVTVLGVVSIVSDLYLIILPLPAVWSLQLPLRRKLAVSAMFFTGSV